MDHSALLAGCAKNKLSETGSYFDLVENQKLPVDQAIQKAFGMSVPQFDQAVRDYFKTLKPLFLALDASKQERSGRRKGRLSDFPSPIPGESTLAPARRTSLLPEGDALIAEVTVRVPEHRDAALRRLNALVNDPKLETLVAHRAIAWDHIQRKEFGPCHGRAEPGHAYLIPKIRGCVTSWHC